MKTSFKTLLILSISLLVSKSLSSITQSPTMLSKAKSEDLSETLPSSSNDQKLPQSPETGLGPLPVRDQEGPQYNMYVIAKTWPGTSCLNEPCPWYHFNDYRQWNQHGLWPNGKKGHENIANCSDAKFDYTAMKEKKADIRITRFWAGLFDSTVIFWQHEMEKHGNCWNPMLGDIKQMPDAIKSRIGSMREKMSKQDYMLHPYFTIVDFVQRELSVHKVLEKAGITPKEESKGNYTEKAIKEAFQAEGVENLIIKCKERDGKSYLEEIRWCLSLDYKPTKCDEPYYTDCDKAQEIYYPPYEPYFAPEKLSSSEEDDDI